MNLGDNTIIKTYLGDNEVTAYLGDTESVNDALTYEIDTVAGTEFRLTGTTGFSYDADIDWGDGTTSKMLTYNDANSIHQYAVPGVYTVKITGLYEAFGNTGYSTSQNLIKKVKNLGNTGLKSLKYFLYQANNLNLVDLGDNDTSMVWEMGNMYFNNAPLDALFGFEELNVSAVTTAKYFCNVPIGYNLDISGFNFISLTSLDSFASSAGSNVTGTLYIGANVTTAAYMLQNADNCGIDFSQAATPLLNSVYRILYGASGSYDLTGMDFSNVTYAPEILKLSDAQLLVPVNSFAAATSLSYLLQDATLGSSINLENVNSSNVSNFSNMFYLSLAVCNASNLNTSSATSLEDMFLYNRDTTPINVSGLIGPHITNLDSFLYNSSASLISGFEIADTSNVTIMNRMLSNTKSSTLDIANLDFSKVTDMSYILHGATTLVLPIDNWDVSHVVDMGSMLSSTSSFDISLWQFDSCTNLSNFCTDMDYTKHIGMDAIVAPLVTLASGLYSNAHFDTIDLTGISLKDVADQSSMFSASTFNSLTTSPDMFLSCTSVSSMFSTCEALIVDLSNSPFYNHINIQKFFYNAYATTITFNQSTVVTLSSAYEAFYFVDVLDLNVDCFDLSTSSLDVTRFMMTSHSGVLPNFRANHYLLSAAGTKTQFIQRGPLSVANYDTALVAWNDAPVKDAGVVMNMGGCTYTLGGLGETARQNLITTNGWTINDDGPI